MVLAVIALGYTVPFTANLRQTVAEVSRIAESLSERFGANITS
jgi:hypothetical protein